jgi:predicted nucleic acid-binding Zn ribbon protein
LSTPDPRTAPDTEGDAAGPPDLAAGALRSARAIATSRGTGRPARLSRRRAPGGGYSGARPDERDPAPIGSILGKSMVELGWVGPLAQARLMGQWASVVGSDIAARCQPVSLSDGELKVSAESTAWATQLRLMAPQILARIARELPAGLVTKLIITGPSAPSWKHGPWSMHGGRGARDTYG